MRLRTGSTGVQDKKRAETLSKDGFVWRGRYRLNVPGGGPTAANIGNVEVARLVFAFVSDKRPQTSVQIDKAIRKWTMEPPSEGDLHDALMQLCRSKLIHKTFDPYKRKVVYLRGPSPLR